MRIDSDVNNFLSNYRNEVIQNTHFLRKLIFENLPDIQEQLDISAKMIGYCYGQKYADLVCTLIPSKKGLKLAFYKGIDLSDPEKILQGNAKFSRYIEITT